ncbi:hypothetical protein JOC70_002212 [Clostridium pascui]|nr:hypothetical protein [Clostridium pascui]
MCILIHPLDTLVPIDAGLFVPCIPYPGLFKPSHLTPKGPPELTALFIILKLPNGVDVDGLPSDSIPG